jgi:hypothetical protein
MCCNTVIESRAVVEVAAAAQASLYRLVPSPAQTVSTTPKPSNATAPLRNTA